MDDKEMKRVIDICRRLEPVINKFLLRMIDRDGADVSLSVVSNMATTLMAHAITMVETRGADVDQFVKILMYEVKNKYDVASSQVQAASIMSKIMSAGKDPDQPLH